MVSVGETQDRFPKVELSNGRLTFVSPKEEEDRAEDMVFEGTLVRKTTLSGTTMDQTEPPGNGSARERRR